MTKRIPSNAYFRIQYKVLNQDPKKPANLVCKPNAQRECCDPEWDENASQYSTPKIINRSDRFLEVLYHIGDKLQVDVDGNPLWDDEDVLRPCERLLREQGYTPLRISPGKL